MVSYPYQGICDGKIVLTGFTFQILQTLALGYCDDISNVAFVAAQIVLILKHNFLK